MAAPFGAASGHNALTGQLDFALSSDDLQPAGKVLAHPDRQMQGAVLINAELVSGLPQQLGRDPLKSSAQASHLVGGTEAHDADGVLGLVKRFH